MSDELVPRNPPRPRGRGNLFENILEGYSSTDSEVKSEPGCSGRRLSNPNLVADQGLSRIKVLSVEHIPDNHDSATLDNDASADSGVASDDGSTTDDVRNERPIIKPVLCHTSNDSAQVSESLKDVSRENNIDSSRSSDPAHLSLNKCSTKQSAQLTIKTSTTKASLQAKHHPTPKGIKLTEGGKQMQKSSIVALAFCTDDVPSFTKKKRQTARKSAKGRLSAQMNNRASEISEGDQNLMYLMDIYVKYSLSDNNAGGSPFILNINHKDFKCNVKLCDIFSTDQSYECLRVWR